MNNDPRTEQQKRVDAEGIGRSVGTAYDVPVEAPVLKLAESEKTEDDDLKNSFTTSSGRKVFLARLQMSCTYDGCLEGSRESNSKHIRKSLVEDVRKAMPRYQAFSVVDEETTVLPDFQWIVGFWTNRGVKTDGSDYNSQLCICCFNEGIPTDLKKFLQVTLAEVDWESCAEDYDITL